MRILINGGPMLGRLTGVGRYGLHLLASLAALSAEDGPEQLGVFDGRSVVSSDAFLEAVHRGPGLAHHEGLKKFVRRIWPRCRDWADRLRRHRLARFTQRSSWTLFHEVNFVSPQCDLPLVTTIHDMGYRRYPQFLPKERLIWLRRRMDASLARSRVILTDSEFTRCELLDLCPRVDDRRVVVVHAGVDLEFFSSPSHDLRREEVGRRFGLPERFVLYLGTLEPRKNLQGLVEAYRRLPSHVQREYPLVLAGMRGWNQGYFRPALEALRRRGTLYEIGYVADADVPALMKAASVFCFPSLYEGFGLPPLEAAACGTPVLSSRAASLPEVLGEAAVYVDPHSPDDIAAGLLRLLGDERLRQTLAAAGPARAARFSWEQCARQTMAAYRHAA